MWKPNPSSNPNNFKRRTNYCFHNGIEYTQLEETLILVQSRYLYSQLIDTYY